MNAHVVAVVIAYYPDPPRLSRLLARLAPQVAQVLVIDNTDHAAVSLDLPDAPRTTVWRLNRNTGIGHALNVGIDRARQQGASHVLLMDQDSLPPERLIDAQLHALARPELKNAAAIAPICRDIKTSQRMPLISRRHGCLARSTPEPSQPPVAVEYMPSSGTLIPMAMLERVGPMRAEYFIDRVDVEWCLRARRMGLNLWVTPDVEMEHDQAVRSVKFRGRTLYLGRDFRAYFHVRNSLAMALRARIPLLWRLDQLIKLPGYIGLHALTAECGPWRMTHLLLRALADGFAGRMGKGYFEHRSFF